jgi:hypothetical protein
VILLKPCARLAVALVILLGVARTASAQSCTSCTPIPVSGAPTAATYTGIGNPSSTTAAGGPGRYMLTVYPTDTISLPAGLTAGTYNGWCGTSTGNPPLEAPQTYAAYSSYSTLPSPFSPGTLRFQATWDEINYILNHKDHVYNGTAATVSDVQTAIWGAVSYYQGAYYYQSLSSLQLQPAGFDLFQEALNYVTTNGAYVVPPGGVRMLLLVAPTPSHPTSQHMVVEVPNCPSLGDRVWNDGDGLGLQNITQVNLGSTLTSFDYTKYFRLSYNSTTGNYSAYQLSANEPGINGVTVNLYDTVPTQGAVPIATTTTGPTPFGYPYLPQGSPGYYQFTGLCTGTYYVAIPNYSTPNQQAALTGLNYTAVHVANGTNSGNDSSNPAGEQAKITDYNVLFPLETLDFGFTGVPPLGLSCSSDTAFDDTYYDSYFVATGGEGSYTYSISSGSLPSWASLNTTTGEITGTPPSATSGVSTFTVKVVDRRGATAGSVSTSCTITTKTKPAINCPATIGTAGVPYSSALVASGGTGNYTYSWTSPLLDSNNLLDGLSLNPQTGAITGIPPLAGTFAFTATVMDGSGATASSGSSSCNIQPAIGLTCGAATPSTGEVGASFGVAAPTLTGGVAPYTFTAVNPTNSLSNMGLTLNADGSVTSNSSSGPVQAGSFSIQIADHNGLKAPGTCPVNVIAPPAMTCAAANAAGEVGVPFTAAKPTVTGGTGPYTFRAIALGNSPSLASIGLAVGSDGSVGQMTGFTAPSGAGSYNIQVTDALGVSAAGSCPIAINPTVSASCSATPYVGDQGQAFSLAAPTVTAGTGTLLNGAGFSFQAIGSNGSPISPATLATMGITFDPATGKVSSANGPTAAVSFSIQVSDSLTAATAAGCNVTVHSAPALACGTSSPARGEVGLGYSTTMAVSGGTAPYTFTPSSASTLAAMGLAATPANPTGNAVLTVATPANQTVQQPGSVTFQVTDNAGVMAVTTCPVTTVAKPALSCSAVVAQGVVNQQFNSPALTSSVSLGSGSFQFSEVDANGNALAQPLLGGLTLDAGTGAIGGLPTTAGGFFIKVTDGNGVAAGNTCGVQIIPAPVLTVSKSSGAFNQGGPASFTITVGNTVAAGGASATGVVLNDNLPTTGGMSWANASASNGAPCTITGGYQLSCPLGTIAPQTSVTVTVSTPTSTPAAACTTQTNVAANVTPASAASPTPASGSLTCTPPPLQLTCPASGYTGYAGAALTFPAITPSGGTPPYTFYLAQPAYVNDPTLTMSYAGGIVSGTPDQAGTFRLGVQDYFGNTAAPSNCSYAFTRYIAPPAQLQVVKTPKGGSFPMNGQASFQIVVSNPASAGAAAATNVSLSDVLPTNGGLTWASVTPSSNCSIANNVLNCSWPSLAAASSVTVTVSSPATTPASACQSQPNPAANATADSGLTATDSGSLSCQPSSQLTLVCPANTATVGVPYSSPTASGGVPPYAFSLVSGSLPPGMTLDPTTGKVTGTPTVGGTYSFQIKVSDAANATATSSGCTIAVSSPPAPICGGDTATIGFWHNQNGQALINAVNGGGSSTALSSWLVQQFPILFGPASPYNLTGSTNSQVASTYMTVFANDKTFAQIFAGALAAYVTNSGLAGGNFAVPYGFNYTAGGTAGKTWNVGASGSGIGLTNNASYTLMQVLLAANQAQSTSPDSTAANVIFSSINQGGDIGTSGCGGVTPLAMSCAAGSATAGTPFSSAVTATGGVGSYTFTLLSGSLPPGLTLSSNGTISGTPTAAAAYSYVVQVTDSQGNTAQTAGCSITVYPAITSSCAGITAVQGVAITPAAMTASGGSGTGYTFSANGLPTGLSMSAAGTIFGTPTVSGTFTYTVTIKDSAGNTGTVNCSVTVASPSPLGLTCPSAATGTVGTAYSGGVTASGGVPPYTYSLYSGSLPTGLTLNTSTGAITGTPTTGGTFAFSIQVKDNLGATAVSSCAGSCGSSVATWNFEAPTGVLSSSQAYTANNLTVTAYGFSGTSAGTAAPLYGNDSSKDLYGLGLSGVASNQIDKAHFVQFDISGVLAAGGTNPQIVVGGVSSTDSFMVYASSTLGSIGTAIGTYTGASYDLIPISLSLPSGTKYISVIAVNSSAIVVSSIAFSVGGCSITVGGSSIVNGDAATIGFWHNKNGQALINSAPASPTTLGNWLASQFPYMYGAGAGSWANLTNASNATVASLFSTLFGSDKTGAQIMGGALAAYFTSTTLAPATTAKSYGFNLSSSGTGGKLYNVGGSGSAIGLTNSANYTVLQLLQTVNLEKQNGTYASNAGAFNVIFSGINQTGDIQ